MFRLNKFLKKILIIFLIIVIIKSILLDFYSVQSNSMYPSLLPGDYILVSKISYKLSTPETIPFTDIKIPHIFTGGIENIKRGDIVLFNPPGFIKGIKKNLKGIYVKRCAALPGDSLKVIEEKLLINNIATSSINNLHKDFVDLIEILKAVPKKGDVIPQDALANKLAHDIILNEGHTVEQLNDSVYLIDNRVVNEYAVTKDYYLMIGDNRITSQDSRTWGFLPHDHLAGKALMVLFSWSTGEYFGSKKFRMDRILKIL